MFGVQSRYDDITIGLSNTVQRQLLSNVLLDHIGEGNVGIYAENTVHWTDWLRTTTGWRGDYFDASVNSTLQQANSGNSQGAIGSQKFTVTVGPFAKTELFIGAGMGYHSNDARSTTVTEVPMLNAAPLLRSSRSVSRPPSRLIGARFDNVATTMVLDTRSAAKTTTATVISRRIRRGRGAGPGPPAP